MAIAPPLAPAEFCLKLPPVELNEPDATATWTAPPSPVAWFMWNVHPAESDTSEAVRMPPPWFAVLLVKLQLVVSATL
eukprot:3940558-Rhodomonas_salina.4